MDQCAVLQEILDTAHMLNLPAFCSDVIYYDHL